MNRKKTEKWAKKRPFTNLSLQRMCSWNKMIIIWSLTSHLVSSEGASFSATVWHCSCLHSAKCLKAPLPDLTRHRWRGKSSVFRNQGQSVSSKHFVVQFGLFRRGIHRRKTLPVVTSYATRELLLSLSFSRWTSTHSTHVLETFCQYKCKRNENKKKTKQLFNETENPTYSQDWKRCKRTLHLNLQVLSVWLEGI